MPDPDINQAIDFLEMLDPGGRHTLGSDTPFGWNGETFEPEQRRQLIKSIQKRQGLLWNCYYGVNRARSAGDQEGRNGKATGNDIVLVRGLPLDIDIIKRPFDNRRLIDFIDGRLTDPLRPSLLINSGGGFQIIYLLSEPINVELFRWPANEEQIQANKQIEIVRRNISALDKDLEIWLRQKVRQI